MRQNSTGVSREKRRDAAGLHVLYGVLCGNFGSKRPRASSVANSSSSSSAFGPSPPSATPAVPAAAAQAGDRKTMPEISVERPTPHPLRKRLAVGEFWQHQGQRAVGAVFVSPALQCGAWSFYIFCSITDIDNLACVGGLPSVEAPGFSPVNRTPF
jgi:hypothetical protein